MYSIYIKSKNCYKKVISKETLKEALKLLGELPKKAPEQFQIEDFQVVDSDDAILPFQE